MTVLTSTISHPHTADVDVSEVFYVVSFNFHIYNLLAIHYCADSQLFCNSIISK